MSKYTIRFEINLGKKCRNYPTKDKSAILNAIQNLEINPRPIGATKLSGRDGYRIRVGDYCIVYTINDTEILVIIVDVDKRSDIYKKH